MPVDVRISPEVKDVQIAKKDQVKRALKVAKREAGRDLTNTDIENLKAANGRLGALGRQSQVIPSVNWFSKWVLRASIEHPTYLRFS